MKIPNIKNLSIVVFIDFISVSLFYLITSIFKVNQSLLWKNTKPDTYNKLFRIKIVAKCIFVKY